MPAQIVQHLSLKASTKSSLRANMDFHTLYDLFALWYLSSNSKSQEVQKYLYLKYIYLKKIKINVNVLERKSSCISC